MSLKLFDKPYYAVLKSRDGETTDLISSCIEVGSLVLILGTSGGCFGFITEDQFDTFDREHETSWWGDKEDFEPIQLLTDA